MAGLAQAIRDLLNKCSHPDFNHLAAQEKRKVTLIFLPSHINKSLVWFWFFISVKLRLPENQLHRQT